MRGSHVTSVANVSPILRVSHYFYGVQFQSSRIRTNEFKKFLVTYGILRKSWLWTNRPFITSLIESHMRWVLCRASVTYVSGIITHRPVSALSLVRQCRAVHSVSNERPEHFLILYKGMQDMERRCEDVEKAVLHNNEIIARQVQEIVCGIFAARSDTNPPVQGRLRGMVLHK